MIAGLTLVAILSAADLSGVLEPQDAQCRVIHYAADGTRHETPPRRPYSRPPEVSTSSSSSSRRGEAHASSSVSASSSSSGGGAAVSRSQSNGRSISRSYDNDGCTVVIDDRPARGE